MCIISQVKFNSSQGSADTRHFSLLGRRSNTPFNRNTNQENLLHRSTITQAIKQQYPKNIVVKDKISTWPTTMLVDSKSGTTVINTKLIEQVISNLLKENETLIHQLETVSKHENKMQKMNREYEGESQLINDQLSRVDEAIENQTREIASYVPQSKKLKETIQNLHDAIDVLKPIQQFF